MAVVLVVEDDAELLQVLTDALSTEGWTVVGAPSIAGALRIARARRIDVVLTDLLMPGGDGLELETVFKATPTLSNIPFVLMTGSPPAMGKVGRRSVLLKPFDVAEASALLTGSLHRGNRPAELLPPLS